MKRDRRSGTERRTMYRFNVSIDVEWEGLVGRKKGTISDLSVLGCFVLCSGDVEDGENVRVFFPLSDGRKLQLWGEVVNHFFEIGFAIRFIEMSDAEREFLQNFVEIIKES